MNENENIEDPLSWLNETPTVGLVGPKHSEGLDDESDLPVDPHVMKPRQIGKSIMRVYKMLGGDRWLLEQAQENPKEFLGMLKTIVPKNLDIDLDTDIHIHLAPRKDTPPIGVQTQQHQLESNREPITITVNPEAITSVDE